MQVSVGGVPAGFETVEQALFHLRRNVNKYLLMIAGSQINTVKQDPGMLRP